MPLNDYGVAVVQSAANTAGTVISNDLSYKQNVKLAEQQFNRNKEMWNLANQYNSPEQQMQRFKAAGLNENLIYGQGNAGNTATTLPQYSAPEYNPPRVDFDVLSKMRTYQDMRLQQTQIDNNKAQHDVILQDLANKQVLNASIMANTDFTKTKNRTAKMLQSTQLEALKANLDMLNQRIKTENLRRGLLSNQINSVNEDVTFKKWRNNLNNMGVNPNDALPYRIGGMLLNSLMPNLLNNSAKSFKDFFKK